MDETGVTEAESKAGKVIGSSLTKQATRTIGSPGAWATIIECVSAVGRRVSPLVIFTGTNLQGQWFPDNFPDGAYDWSVSSWSNAEIAMKWLLTVFIPETAPSMESLWRDLSDHGSKTHTSAAFMYAAFKAKIYLLFLPSHYYHARQPLDVGVFGPLKECYHQQLAGFVDFGHTAPSQKQRFQAYEVASKQAITSIQDQGWISSCGHFPY